MRWMPVMPVIDWSSRHAPPLVQCFVSSSGEAEARRGWKTVRWQLGQGNYRTNHLEREREKGGSMEMGEHGAWGSMAAAPGVRTCPA